MNIPLDSDGLSFIASHENLLCNDFYRVMDAATADALSYFFSGDSPYESFLFAAMVRYRAKHYFQQMQLKRCIVEDVLNNGIHLKFPDSEYKIWKSFSNPNATRTKRAYLTQSKFKQDALPFQGMVNRYPLPLRQDSPLRLVVLWDINAEQEIELFLVCPRSLTLDFANVQPHWRIPIPRRTASAKKKPHNESGTRQSNDLDLTFEDDNTETVSES